MIEIIAEIGVNHNGDVNAARALIDAAVACGCDTVKFQLWNTERVYPREDWEAMKSLELSRGYIAGLKQYAEGRIGFLCTPDEIGDAEFLRDIGCDRIKTSSQDITNIPFLTEIARLGMSMIVSTGAATEDDVSQAINVIGGVPLTLLHCVSAYPAPLDQMNLRALQYLAGFYRPVGLSDHTNGNHAALMALALGATVFEKHLTLDRFQAGPDHAASADVSQMLNYVSVLRKCETALGDGIKRVMPCEVETRERFIKFIERRQGNVDGASP